MDDDKLFENFERATVLFQNALRKINEGKMLLKQLNEIFPIDTHSLEDAIKKMNALIKASEADEIHGIDTPERQDALAILHDAKKTFSEIEELYESSVRNTKLAAEMLDCKAIMPERLKIKKEIAIVKNLMQIAKGLPPWYVAKDEKE